MIIYFVFLSHSTTTAIRVLIACAIVSISISSTLWFYFHFIINLKIWSMKTSLSAKKKMEKQIYASPKLRWVCFAVLRLLIMFYVQTHCFIIKHIFKTFRHLRLRWEMISVLGLPTSQTWSHPLKLTLVFFSSNFISVVLINTWIYLCPF